MRGLADSRTLSRMLAAGGLVLGPLLFLLDTLLDPAWSGEDEVAYLADVAASRTRYLAAEIVATVGALAFLAGMLGVLRLLRGRRVTLGQLAAALVTIGLVGQTASLAFNLVDVAMADFDDRDAIALFRGELVDGTLYAAYWLAFVLCGFVLGSILLAVSLLRRRLVPVWSPPLLALAVSVWFVAGDEQVVNALSLAALTVALLPLARLVWSLTDEEWGRWAPLEEGPAEAS